MHRRRTCAWCQEKFDPLFGWHRFCGPKCRAEGTLSGRKSLLFAEWICVYCGQIGDSLDHVPPESSRPRIIELGLRDDWLFTEVRCCRECNSALIDDGGWTVASRKRFVKAWLCRRYARLLCMAEWTPEEVAELGPGLQTYVASGVIKKELIERRIRY